MSKEKEAVFTPVPSDFSFARAEHDIIRFWQERQVYRRSLERRAGCPKFVFYEGPPTANGMPHPGHCLTRTIKDIFPRYQTMAGRYCERKAGWDTHGLPVEIEVCKELGIIDGGKAAIEAYGIDRFNRACVDSVFRYKREWEALTNRIGFWVNLDEAYVTFHQSYVESVWWALKRLFDEGLLYQGHKVVWWWAQGGTALSSGEVGEGYREVDDPAITVRLDLVPASCRRLGLDGEVSLLVWTTTPWTLSSNCAAAVGPDVSYAAVRADGHTYLLAEALVSRYFEGNQCEVVKTFRGSDLVGLAYEPLFRYAEPVRIDNPDQPSDRHWVVIPGDFVDLETGTGIVHIAPAFGEDDYRVCREQGIGFLCFVRPDGTFDERVSDRDPYDGTPIAGRFCKDADKSIIRVLKDRGMIIRHEQYRHAYPFCPRAENDPLIQYARKSWFIRTSAFIKLFLENNRHIGWQPEHIRDGRFGNFLENNVDWALSRERYWGTPLPVWVCEKTGKMECVGSYAELMAKPGVTGMEAWEQARAADPSLPEDLKIHRPYIDAITYQSPWDPTARMRRVPEVIDCWFDAGSMPFAQWGYPHQSGSEERFEANFPADFISEALDQTRGWFYALLAISTLLFGRDGKRAWPHPFRNCICLGLIHGEDGLKLSKRLKNYRSPSELFESYSADAFRWSMIFKTPPTSSIRLAERNVEEAQRELLIRWYNCWSFFVIYANLDGFRPVDAPQAFLRSLGVDDPPAPREPVDRPAWRPVDERGELDRWISHYLAQTTLDVREALDEYDCYRAAQALNAFLDGLSNWYVRRSRGRFWASRWDRDKTDAYWTLYETLLRFAQLMAPFTPFFAEVTWRNLAAPLAGAPESVHLSDYPEARPEAVDQSLLEAMALTREAVSLGLSARRVANIRVRQPLALCEIIPASEAARQVLEGYIPLLAEELNIKQVAFSDRPEQYVDYTVKPNFKTLGPKLGARVKRVAAVLGQAAGAALYREMTEEGSLTLEVDGDTVVLSPEDVEIRLQPKSGFTAAHSARMVVALSTEITPELRQEGWAREVIRLIQDQRKALNVAYDARIRVMMRVESPELLEAFRRFESEIRETVLATSIDWNADLPADARTEDVDGFPVRLAISL
ncbi:MAG TPA: isoleucine--tRNA ligase [Candidatus Hydrogenedentes bacterium]|nr:isoleucine--tRNA ligase [Candidatus Hydrogenedentota bacterium]